jgi:Bacteriophage baseplate protein W
MNIAFPYALDPHGRTALAGDDAHIRQLLEQLLFTRPGERVNRPDFGCGLLDLVFGPNSPEIAAALHVTIGAAVQQWLGDLIEVVSLDVDAEESTLRVTLGYRVKATEALAAAAFAVPGAL